MMDEKWDKRFLDLAVHISEWSKNPSTKVGAVIVRPDKTVASMGFNGFPRGIEDLNDRLLNREYKLAMTVHAELNAILSSHVPVRGHTLYCTMPCCERCAAHVIQSGISRVVTYVASEKSLNKDWLPSFARGRGMFREAGIEVMEYKNE